MTQVSLGPPNPGTVVLCILCAYEKPWGVWDDKTGAAVCKECREAARNFDATKRELEMVRSQARTDNLRAEDADRYERWLEDIGKVIECGHIDERLPRCIEEEFGKLPYAKRLHDAIEAIAGSIPEGFDVRIELEYHGGGVTLVNTDGESVEFPTNGECLAEELEDALEPARKLSAP